MRFYRTGQTQFTRRNQFRTDMLYGYLLMSPYAGRKRSVHQAFPSQAFHINLTDDQLFFERETFGSGKQTAVFVNQGIPRENHVGSRFTKTTGREYVSRQAPCRLLCQQRTEVLVLTDIFRIGRQVEDNLGSFQHQGRTRGYGRPYI